MTIPISTPSPQASDAEIRALFERLALDAGRAIMDVYREAFTVDHKDDDSPVTAADRASESIILSGLRSALPGIACVAEEEFTAGPSQGAIPDEFVLIDPLDGTREFVGRNGDFTVNIALVRNGMPEIGVVYAPCGGRFFSAHPSCAEEIVTQEGRETERRRLSVAEAAVPPRVVASRSHLTQQTQDYITRLEAAEIVSVGSSLKFCLIAAGEADLYPRFGPTMEWDTAAADAVLRAAGGMTVTVDGEPLRYGKPGFANPSFIAHGKFPVGIPAVLES